jgi:hypothetical protein
LTDQPECSANTGWTNHQGLGNKILLGALLRMPSFLQLQFESARPGWQQLIDHANPITDDRMVYVCQRYRLEDWRHVLARTNQTLPVQEPLPLL